MNLQIPKKVLHVLNRLNLSDSKFLGRGGEGYVFSYKRNDALKIFTKETITNEYLNQIVKLQKVITQAKLSFSTPQIKDIGNIDGTYFTIEKKLTGKNMEQVFPTLGTKDKYILLKSYYEAIKTLNTIELPNLPFGNIIQTDSSITDGSWPKFLMRKIRQRVAKAGDRLQADVFALDAKIQRVEDIINKELVTENKFLIHADYFINQVLVNDDHKISAILDISYHAVTGDRRLDAASVVFFYDIKDYLPEYINYLIGLEVNDYGDSIVKYNNIYKIYYCLYFSNIYSYIPSFYDVIVKNLNDENLWRNLS